jgi:hypothetical protein
MVPGSICSQWPSGSCPFYPVEAVGVTPANGSYFSAGNFYPSTSGATVTALGEAFRAVHRWQQGLSNRRLKVVVFL